MSMSRTILFGRVGKAPELKAPSSGEICAVSVVTTDVWKDKNGKRQEHTEWHRVVFEDELARAAARILRKGSQVYVEGRIQTRKWKDKDEVERRTTEIIAEKYEALSQQIAKEEETPA
jgi:single-strand DNA-binding protein